MHLSLRLKLSAGALALSWASGGLMWLACHAGAASLEAALLGAVAGVPLACLGGVLMAHGWQAKVDGVLAQHAARVRQLTLELDGVGQAAADVAARLEAASTSMPSDASSDDVGEPEAALCARALALSQSLAAAEAARATATAPSGSVLEAALGLLQQGAADLQRAGGQLEADARVAAALGEVLGESQRGAAALGGVAIDANALAVNACIEAARLGESGRPVMKALDALRTLCETAVSTCNDLRHTLGRAPPEPPALPASQALQAGHVAVCGATAALEGGRRALAAAHEAAAPDREARQMHHDALGTVLRRLTQLLGAGGRHTEGARQAQRKEAGSVAACAGGASALRALSQRLAATRGAP